MTSDPPPQYIVRRMVAIVLEGVVRAILFSVDTGLTTGRTATARWGAVVGRRTIFRWRVGAVVARRGEAVEWADAAERELGKAAEG